MSEPLIRVVDLAKDYHRGGRPVAALLGVSLSIDRGEFVAVLADRTLPGGRDRIARANFLGEAAPFPEGPFRLSMVMQLPLVLTVALKTGPNRYEVFMEEIAGGEPVPAAEKEVIRQWITALGNTQLATAQQFITDTDILAAIEAMNEALSRWKTYRDQVAQACGLEHGPSGPRRAAA